MAELKFEQASEQEPGLEEETVFPSSPVDQEPDIGSEGGEEKGQKVSTTLPQAQTGRADFKTLLFDILETLLLTIVIYAVLSTFIGRFKVFSVSMEPTLHEGQYLLISKQTHKIWSLKRGDVIVFQYPRNPKKDYIKRLIGLPGEQVELRNGKLYINGELTPEPWLSGRPWAGSGQWQLGENEYFVMGDNRNNSSDSRAWGTINSQHIIGKAIFRYWPLQFIGFIRHGPKPTATPTAATPFESVLISPLPAGALP